VTTGGGDDEVVGPTAVLTTPDQREALHLLEVGLPWPPQTFLANKLEGLAARGLRVTVATVIAPGQVDPGLRGVEVLPQPHWEESTPRLLIGVTAAALWLILRSPGSLVGALRAARRPLRESRAGGALGFAKRLRSYLPLAPLRPDIVHFEWNSAAVQFQPLARVWGCPTVVSCHGSEVNVRPHLPGGAAFARPLRASFAGVSAVHCVSRAVAAEAVARGMDPRLAWLIAPGIETSWFRPPRRRSRRGAELRVVSVGDLRWLKGHEYAVQAMRHLADWDVPAVLELVGGDPCPALAERSDRGRIEAAVDRLGLGDHVRLLGTLSPAEVRARLHEADVLLHMSVSEGLSVAVLEAMACGLPVVVTDCGGMREAVTHGLHGFIVPLRAPALAAAALLTLREDPALGHRMGAAGRERVASEFTLDRHVEAFARLYESVAAGRFDGPAPPAGLWQEHDIDAASEEVRELRLLSIGRLDWMQGFDQSMEAARLLLQQGIHCRYRIVGDGACRDALWFERHQLGLERHVDLVDGLAGCSRHLEWADVLLDTSPAEQPCSPLLAHAQSRGLSVLTTADPEAMAERLVRIAEGSALRDGRSVGWPRARRLPTPSSPSHFGAHRSAQEAEVTGGLGHAARAVRSDRV
jgi:glycosyltransferase involved in cell wall biosynthesis